MDLKEILKNSGFADKEVILYSTLLELGPSVVSHLAKRAKINRSTVYVILETFQEMGLITFSERRGVKIASPLPAEYFVSYLEAKAKLFSELAKAARKVMPKVKMAKTEIAEPKVLFFSNAKGRDAVFADALRSLAAIRIDAASKKPTPALHPGVNIYGDKVILMSSNQDSGVVVESQQIAAALKKALGTA